MNLKSATLEDSHTLARIHVESWRAAYGDVVPKEKLDGFSVAEREKSFSEAILNSSEETYLVESDEKPIGILTIGYARDPDLNVDRCGEIWGIYLLPGYWRKGFGTELIAIAENMLLSRGCRHIILWVLESNDRARRFYEAQGYLLDGGTKTIYLGKPLLAVRYRKAFTTT